MLEDIDYIARLPEDCDGRWYQVAISQSEIPPMSYVPPGPGPHLLHSALKTRPRTFAPELYILLYRVFFYTGPPL